MECESIESSYSEYEESWSKEEKYYLLQGLKSYGSFNIEAIHQYIPTKSPEQIKTAIAHYKEKALSHPIIAARKKNDKIRVNDSPRIPLACWAKVLTESLSFEELQTETATALRLIAEFDNIPTAVCTEHIDFRKIYHAIANAVEGKSLPEDKYTAMVLEKCIMDTALLSRGYIRNSCLKFFIDNIDISQKDMSCFSRATNDNTLATIRHLASQSNFNPLNIPEEYLKLSNH